MSHLHGLTIAEARELVHDYNTGRYGPTRNVDLDRGAQALFQDGMAADRRLLVQQLVFVGKDYGGAKNIPFERVAAAIADRLGANYVDLLARAHSLEQELPRPETVAALLQPFLGVSMPGVRKHNFEVWGTKWLHFLRPDAFPMLDSLARCVLGLRHSRSYADFLCAFRDEMTALRSTIDRLAVEDSSPTVLKRLDKILYQKGLELRRAGLC